MRLNFGYLYKFITLYFLFFKKKAESNRLKKSAGQRFVILFFWLK